MWAGDEIVVYILVYIAFDIFHHRGSLRHVTTLCGATLHPEGHGQIDGSIRPPISQAPEHGLASCAHELDCRLRCDWDAGATAAGMMFAGYAGVMCGRYRPAISLLLVVF